MKKGGPNPGSAEFSPIIPIEILNALPKPISAARWAGVTSSLSAKEWLAPNPTNISRPGMSLLAMARWDRVGRLGPGR